MQMFRECGFMAFVVAFIGIVAVLLGIVALSLAIFKPRWGVVLGVVALAVSCSTPGAGALGTVLGKQKTDEALSGESVSPEDKARIREMGYAEAGQCTTLGASFGALPLLLGLAALGLGLLRRKTDAAPSLQ